MIEKHDICNDSNSIKENLYLNIYVQLMDRIAKGDGPAVEALKQLGREISNWPDMEMPSNEILKIVFGKGE